ncbi:unnamed protein product [Rotaria magnacalcarata]|uniref:Uncharacterized protein n=2 Tax=Rotaria magnacalcarata TaxID=392030 RepID=A0A8S2KRZ2_9BILA|nr:unnamed protein product [Rotaria magnacalcarata]
MCVKLNNNTFVVLPGIKSKMKLLKAALTKKRNERRREMSKTSSNTISTNNTSNTILSNSSNEQPTIISSSIASNSKSDDEQKQHIINLIDELCEKMKEEKNKQDFHLKESIDYEIIANYMLNKASIKCQCGITATLGKKSNSYILSNYIRHLTKSNSCTMIRQKLENLDGNVSLDNASNIDNSNTADDPIISDNSNSTLFIQIVVGKRRKNQSSLSSSQLDSNELIPLKKKAGIVLNDGSFIIKKGIMYKVDVFTRSLYRLNEQHLTDSFQHFNSNGSTGLIIPEILVQKFPFLLTLMNYSNFIINSKIDFTFFNIMMNNIIKNATMDERGYRYDNIIRQFASSLYILGGRAAYEFVRLNIPAFIPSTQVIQASIISSQHYLTEGLFDFLRVRDYFSSKQSTLAFCAEDSTTIVPKITYDSKSNIFIGFSLPLDQNGLRIPSLYSTDSFRQLENWYLNESMAKLLVANLIQPLSYSSGKLSPYLLAAYGTDNTFKATDVISRWRCIYHRCKANGIRLIGFSTDCDSRYLNAMKLSLGFFGDFIYDGHPDNFKIDVPSSWNWFLMRNKQLFICMQDPMHICTKLRNRLLSKTATLVLGDQIINIKPLYYVIDNFFKLDHGLVQSDVNPKDRQNYGSCEKISNDKVLKLLDNISNSFGISIYLQFIISADQKYSIGLYRKTTNVIDRIFHAWVVVFIFRCWSMWINSMDRQTLDLFVAQHSNSNFTPTENKNKTKRDFFITYQSHFSVEINAHSLVYLAVLFSEGQISAESLTIYLQNSQTCENTFRSARSISSTCSGGVNFTVFQFLSRIKKLSMLQSIKNNVGENKLRFPQHHKQSKISRNNVNDAYQYVIKLMSPLNLHQWLRNQQTLSIKQLSANISQQFQRSWTKELNANKNDDSDTESDSETSDTMADDASSNHDTDEDLDFENGVDSIYNVTTSVHRGVRLVDDVKQEHAEKYFRVTLNNQIKFLHKQTACWLLEKDKSSLPADRLSRVQEN